MESLFDVAQVEELKARVARVTPDSERQWGTMTAAQAMAHCSAGMKMALGEVRPRRVLIGRLLGPLVKPMALKDGEPMRRNSPTAKDLVVKDDRDLATEKEQLRDLIDRFSAGGPKGCTTHPHAFFGRLKPEQWSKLMHKHLDHHLRQFGV